MSRWLPANRPCFADVDGTGTPSRKLNGLDLLVINSDGGEVLWENTSPFASMQGLSRLHMRVRKTQNPHAPQGRFPIPQARKVPT